MRRIIVAITFLFALLHSTFPVYAIGFDAEKIYQSVFVISTEEGFGSGFAIGQNCILTNAHVVGDSQTVQVNTEKNDSYKGHVISIDSYQDLAVVLVEDAKFQPIVLANESEIIIGDDVYALGSPEGFAYTITKGILSAKNREFYDAPGLAFLQTDAPINPGNSGGPLLNEKGRVIGVNVSKWFGESGVTEGISFSIPAPTVKEYLENNEFPVDRKGNISGSLNLNDYKSFTDGSNLSSSDRTIRDLSRKLREANDKNNTIQTIMIASLAANALLLLIFLLKKTKRNLTPPNKANAYKNRTDFDIDILD